MPLPAAYALARFHFVGDKHLLLLILVFRVTLPVVLSLPTFLVFARLGLVNSPVGIGLVHCLFNLPVTIWILESFIRTVPREFDETAFLDGHSRAGFFFRHLERDEFSRKYAHRKTRSSLGERQCFSDFAQTHPALIPLIAPGIGVAAFFCFVFSWIEVVFAKVLTVTAGKPITVASSAMFGFQTDIGAVMAMTCLSLIPAVVLLILLRNHLAKGYVLRS